MTARTRLFELLPAALRQRDAELGSPLAALLGLVGDQVLQLREDLRQLYDDQFIETCAEWVVPYIGDLIGHEPRHGTLPRIASPRAEVARTVGYRRRKGTVAVLQQVGQDVTGWPTRVTEVFRILATTQNLNFTRPDHAFTPDLRRARPLQARRTGFSTIATRPDVRADRQQSLPDVVAHVWRLRAFPLQRVTPFSIDATRHTFSPLGDPTPLFSRPADTEAASARDDLADVPGPIGRRELHDRLATYYGEDRSLWVRVDDALVPITQVDVADLSDHPTLADTWGLPTKPVPKDSQIRVAIDPVLGRLTVSRAVKSLVVGYHVGAPAGLGGGQYERDSLGPDAPAATAVLHDPPSLADALAELLASPASEHVIELADSATHLLALASLHVPPGARVTLRAADRERPVLELAMAGLTLDGGGELILDGLVITGGPLVVPAAGLRALTLSHCTLVPGLRRTIAGRPASPGSASLVIAAADLQLTLRDCVTGPLRAVDSARVALVRSVVDAGPDGRAYAAPDELAAGAPLDADRCTIVGKIHALSLGLVSNSILHGAVISDRRQTGCLRFTCLPPDSAAPRRFRCLPGEEDDPELAPQFTSLRYGAPAYAQLSRRTAPTIRGGADDESEPGVFHDLYEAHREGNLRARLDEYLRLGLRVGVTFVT